MDKRLHSWPRGISSLLLPVPEPISQSTSRTISALTSLNPRRPFKRAWALKQNIRIAGGEAECFAKCLNGLDMVIGHMNSIRKAKGFILRVENVQNTQTIYASAPLLSPSSTFSTQCAIPDNLPGKAILEQIVRGGKYKYTTENDVCVELFSGTEDAEFVISYAFPFYTNKPAENFQSSRTPKIIFAEASWCRSLSACEELLQTSKRISNFVLEPATANVRSLPCERLVILAIF